MVSSVEAVLLGLHRADPWGQALGQHSRAMHGCNVGGASGPAYAVIHVGSAWGGGQGHSLLASRAVEGRARASFSARGIVELLASDKESSGGS